MFELLGLEPRDALLGYGEVSRLIHPDDGDLMKLVEAMFGTGETTVDRMFACITPTGAGCGCAPAPSSSSLAAPSPTLSASPSTSPSRCGWSSAPRPPTSVCATPSRTVSEAFVLWDSENRLVMCNSKYQQLHGIPDAALVSGTPYAEVIAAGRKPLVRSQVVAEGKPEDGGRSFELQLEDGRWLQINERRTKTGGFVSVGNRHHPVEAPRGPADRGRAPPDGDHRRSSASRARSSSSRRSRWSSSPRNTPRKRIAPRPPTERNPNSSPTSATSCARR
ncbi:MAG: PAS-domain containing protein [Bauldia sp.]